VFISHKMCVLLETTNSIKKFFGKINELRYGYAYKSLHALL